ncbi:MAG: hypothetical protein DMG87_14700 [Acidobacteria bacterium]|nr:MAG: hypothetical protein DMG87_14700 [Acidobacteriota bacterium]
MRVLIIEDEPRLAENVARTLRETAGYAVDVAADGQEGLFLAESNAYDAVLLDLMLPKLDGMQVLRRIRESGQHTPVLVLTARDDKESIVALLNAGADDYLTKPFDLGELLEHLYDYNWEKFSNVIEVYISGLRRKLDHGSEQPLIRTLRGQGYVLQG